MGGPEGQLRQEGREGTWKSFKVSLKHEKEKNGIATKELKLKAEKNYPLCQTRRVKRRYTPPCFLCLISTSLAPEERKEGKG